MIRNLKILGLVLVTVLALSALIASAASASRAYWFNSDGDWTVLSGSNIGASSVFTTHAGNLSCTTLTYSGLTSATTSTTIKVLPHYTSCTLKPLPGHATIDMNGCEYEFHADGQRTTESFPNGEFDTETTIVCPTTTNPHVTHEIKVTVILGGVTKCRIDIEHQSLGTGVVWTNETNGSGVKGLRATFLFSNIKYTQTAGTGEGKCATTTTTKTGSYVGEATLHGKSTGGEATNIWAE